VPSSKEGLIALSSAGFRVPHQDFQAGPLRLLHGIHFLFLFLFLSLFFFFFFLSSPHPQTKNFGKEKSGTPIFIG